MSTVIERVNEDAPTADYSGVADILTAADAERLVEALQTFKISEIGSNDYLYQHINIQKLNLQAHHSVKSNADNFVMEALVTFDKMPLLIHELVMIEAWREKVFPQIKDALHKNCAIRSYHVLFHEATLCNLLEVVMYNDYVAEACGDILIELVDYCCRKVQWICHDQHMRENEEEGASDDFSRQVQEILFRSSISTVTILRYLTEHASKLPLGVMNRMLDTHDVQLLVVPLIENSPWTRRDREKGTWEKYIEQQWKVVEPYNLLQLTVLEAQPWLVLFNLMCDPKVRERYHYNTFRKDSILRVRKYLNDAMLDQLPVLADLQRVMDELTIMEVSLNIAPAPTSQNAFVLEQVAEVRESVLGRTDWDATARAVLTRHFGASEGRDDPIIAALAGMYGDEGVEDVLLGTAGKQRTLVSVTLTAVDTAQVVLARFELTPATQECTQQQTSKGLFDRFQLKQVAGDEASTPLPPLVRFQVELVLSDGSVQRLAASEELGLAAGRSDATPEFEWRTIGGLEQGIVMQLQLSGSAAPSQKLRYTLGTCFVSIRHLDK